MSAPERRIRQPLDLESVRYEIALVETGYTDGMLDDMTRHCLNLVQEVEILRAQHTIRSREMFSDEAVREAMEADG